jgi:hypothetical protein
VINVFTVDSSNQSRLVELLTKMRRHPGPAPYLQEALTIATFEPGTYDVVESFARPAAWSLRGSGCEPSLGENALKLLD